MSYSSTSAHITEEGKIAFEATVKIVIGEVKDDEPDNDDDSPQILTNEVKIP